MEEDELLASLPWPMLTKSNYVTWEVVMKVYLEAHGLWDAIDGANAPADPATDRLALAAIHRRVTKSTLLKIARNKTAKEAWQALRTMHLGTEPVMRARARALARELESVRMKGPEPVDDFVARVTALVFDIRAHGGEVEESHIVRRILRGVRVSPEFFDIAVVIEVLCDLESMTVDDLVGRLKAYEIRMRDRLMTRSEWEAEMKRRGEEGCGGGGFGRRRGRRRRGGDAERSNDLAGKKDRKFDKSKVRCYSCRDYGHFASECSKSKK